MAEKTYKELEVELEGILQRIEQAEYEDLDQLLADYEAGKQCIAQLEKRLDKATNSIKKVKKAS